MVAARSGGNLPATRRRPIMRLFPRRLQREPIRFGPGYRRCMAGEMTVKQVLILTLGAALAVASTPAAAQYGGRYGGAHANAGAQAHASSYTRSSSYGSSRSYGGGFVDRRGHFGGFSHPGDGYGGDFGPAYAVGVPVHLAGGSGFAVGRAGPSAPFGYPVHGFGRDYQRVVTGYGAGGHYESGHGYGSAPINVERHYDDRGGRYGYSERREERFYTQGSQHHGPTHVSGPPAHVIYESARHYSPPRPIHVSGPPVHVSQPPVFIDSPPVHVNAPPVYVDSPPVYVDAPPVYVDAARVHVRPSDVHVRPSDVHVRAPEVHVRPSQVHVAPAEVEVSQAQVHVAAPNVHHQEYVAPPTPNQFYGIDEAAPPPPPPPPPPHARPHHRSPTEHPYRQEPGERG